MEIMTVIKNKISVILVDNNSGKDQKIPDKFYLKDGKDLVIQKP